MVISVHANNSYICNIIKCNVLIIVLCYIYMNEILASE